MRSKILLLLLGLKGLSVLKALSTCSLNVEINCIIGKDKLVSDDFSNVISDFCDQHGIAFSFRGENPIDHENFDYLLAAGWRWIIRHVPEEKILVFHDSLLPKYRGFAPLVNALINREPYVGASALFGAEDYDQGNIILQDSLKVNYPTTIDNEITRISAVYGKLAVNTLTILLQKPGFKGTPQDQFAATYSLWRDDDDYRINWNDSASNIEHFISCVGAPYLGASSMMKGKLFRISTAVAVDDVQIENRTAGKIIFLTNGFPTIVCGNGLILIKSIKDDEGQEIIPFSNIRSRFY